MSNKITEDIKTATKLASPMTAPKRIKKHENITIYNVFLIECSYIILHSTCTVQ